MANPSHTAEAPRAGRSGVCGRRSGQDRKLYLCPCCGSPALRRMPVRTFFDVLLFGLLWAPYRCRRCFRRFRLLIPAVEYGSRVA